MKCAGYWIITALAIATGGQGFSQSQKPAGAPPTEQDLRIKAALLKPNTFCVTLGRVLRKPDGSPKGDLWEKVLLERARTNFDVERNEIGYIRERRLRVGMPWCAAYAAVREPDYGNRTVTAGGERHQLVYRARRLYVYIEHDRVTAWQD